MTNTLTSLLMFHCVHMHATTCHTHTHTHTHIHTQLAYQLLLRSLVKEALQTYKNAFNLDETSVPALAGIIHCQIVEGQLGEAEQQLREVQSSIGKQANLLFLTVLLAYKKGQPHGDVMKALEEMVDVHFGTIKVRCHGNPSITCVHLE